MRAAVSEIDASSEESGRISTTKVVLQEYNSGVPSS